MAIFDAFKNFAKTKVIGTYNATATVITVEDASALPSTTPFPWVWYDGTTYPDPSDDPNVEINTVTGINGNNCTLDSSGGNRLAIGGTSPSTKSTSGSTYYVTRSLTKEDLDDIETAGIDVGDKYTWITEHNAVGDGVADDKSAFDAAVAAGKTYIVCPHGTWRIGSNLTLASTITLKCLPGCSLAPDSGVTLTINGDIDAGNHQIFGGAGTVTISNTAAYQHIRWDGTASDDVKIAGARVTYAKVVESSGLSTASTGPVTCQIAHGYGSTPDEKQISLCAYRSTGTGNPDISGLWLQSVDGTNINVRFNVTSAAASTELTVVATILPYV